MESKEGVPGRTNAAEEDPLVSPAAILEGLPDAVVAIARDERIVFVNALAEELFGYRREELLGKPVQTLWPEAVRDRYTRNMQLYFATEHPLRFTIRADGLRRDGSRFPMDLTASQFDGDDGPQITWILRDVTEQAQLQEQLRQAQKMDAMGGSPAASPTISTTC